MTIKTFLALVLLLFFLQNIFADESVSKKKQQQLETLGLVERMNINKIDLPINNNGSTGENAHAFYPNGQTSLSFLFLGGLATSAHVNGELRVSWETYFAKEWQPGVWGMDPNDPLAKFYVVNSNDGYGSQSYIDWADAVNLGAAFQDINNDGIYDPYVDKPDVLGNRTIWFPINDGVPLDQRIPGLNTKPIGLEMHVTVWAWSRTDEWGNAIFFRYRIINANDTTKNDLIFSIWEDADIGNAGDDLVACDTILNLGYTYNDADDLRYGTNPPAHGIHLLQGPVVPSVGDTAFRFNGSFFGIDTLTHMKNLPMTSFTWILRAHPVFPNPSTATMARNYQLGGYDGLGNLFDPTAWGIGGAINTNPIFAFSGDPVTGSGWIDTTNCDKSLLVTCGPFDLAANDKQDIIIAYEVSQGINAINSIEVLQYTAQITERFFKSNFVDNINNNPDKLTRKFILSQNYPNPFNLNTTIRYSLPKSIKVSLTIYNILGQKVRTLVNKKQTIGNYEVMWSGKNDQGLQLASGLYLYQLKVGGFIQTKKMLLL